MSIRKWYKGASGAIALALSAAVVLPARADDGGDADIAASKEAEQRTKADISNTEARLTQIGVKANRLKVDAAKAEAASIAARQRLSTSIGEAMGAQDAVDSADKQVDAVRRQLSGISTSIYKHGARAVAGGRFSLSAADYRQAREKARAYRLLANKTNRDLQRFKSARFEAATLQKKADDKAAAEKDVAQKADEASAEASRVASNAETEIRTISAERDRLISKLAAQKGTTAELVRRQQDEKEAAAKAEAEQESQRVVQTANERALRAASQEAAEQTSPQQADGHPNFRAQLLVGAPQQYAQPHLPEHLQSAVQHGAGVLVKQGGDGAAQPVVGGPAPVYQLLIGEGNGGAGERRQRSLHPQR